MDLSFSGAGFMGCYYFGVADCLRKYIPKDRIKRVAGTSAGALIASYYILDLPCEDALAKIVGMTEGIRQRKLGVFDRNHQIVDMLPKLLDELMPENAHKVASGKLFICMTRLKDMKKVIVSEYETRKDLIDALNCSSFIPFWSGNHCSTYKGVRHIDGGFTDNLPLFDEHTIKICCFSGSSDIAPFDRTKLEVLKGKILGMPLYFNLANFTRIRKALFPPPAQFFLNLVERGFQDTKNFILSNDLIKCEPCYKASLDHLPVLPSITPTVSPNISRAGSFRNLTESDEFLTSSNELFLTPTRGLVTDRSKMSLNDKHQKEANRKVLKEISKRLEDELNKETEAANVPSIVIDDSSDQHSENQPDNSDSNSTGSAETSSSSSGSQTLPADSNVVILAKNKRDGAKDRGKKSKKRDSIEGTDINGNTTTNSSKKENPFDLSSNLILPEKFTMAPNSCPPSPSLRRQCKDCLRLRQEARLDHVEELMKAELHKFTSLTRSAEPKSRSKIARPLIWLRQLGMKTTYRLYDE